MPDPRGQAEQHGLGLVVEGVAEQHRHCGRSIGDGVERAVTRGPRSGLRSAGAAHVDGDRLDRGEAEVGKQVGYCARPCSRALLQSMVDRDAANAEPQPWPLERRRSREGQRVGTPAAGNEDEPAKTVRSRLVQLREHIADGAPDGGNRDGRAHGRRPASIARGRIGPRTIRLLSCSGLLLQHPGHPQLGAGDLGAGRQRVG